MMNYIYIYIFFIYKELGLYEFGYQTIDSVNFIFHSWRIEGNPIPNWILQARMDLIGIFKSKDL